MNNCEDNSDEDQICVGEPSKFLSKFNRKVWELTVGNQVDLKFLGLNSGRSLKYILQPPWQRKQWINKGSCFVSSIFWEYSETFWLRASRNYIQIPRLD